MTRSFRSGCGSFNLVDQNLRKAIAARISVSVTTVVTSLNLNGLPDLTRYLIDLDIPFRYSIVKGEHIDAQLLDEHLSAFYQIMQEAIERGCPVYRTEEGKDPQCSIYLRFIPKYYELQAVERVHRLKRLNFNVTTKYAA